MKTLKKSLLILLLIFLSVPAFSEVYKNNATVSFYAEDFHGKKTSNGETFNMNALTCASKTFPFDTELKVTNLKNGKSVIVRVNDRGPFVPDRELDLSKAAATQLGMISSGTAQVKIEIIKLGPETKLSKDTAASANRLMTERYGANWNKGNESITKGTGTSGSQSSTGATSKTASTNKKTVSEAPANSKFEIQVGSFGQKENAHQLAKKLYGLGFREIYIRSSGEVYRVVLKEISKASLSKTEETLKDAGYKDYIIRIQK